MKVTYVRSNEIYRKIMEAPIEKKNDIYRYELMMPFKGKQDCYRVPMKAAALNGYDAIMASSMLGHIAPTKVDYSQKANIESISPDLLWSSCEQSIRKSLECFISNGISLPTQEYLFTILLANAESPYISLNEGYCGDGVFRATFLHGLFRMNTLQNIFLSHWLTKQITMCGFSLSVGKTILPLVK